MLPIYTLYALTVDQLRYPCPCLTIILFQTNGPDWPARIKHLMQLAPLSYSLVIMMKDKIYGVRDPYGNRPLCIGKIVPLTLGKRK